MLFRFALKQTDQCSAPRDQQHCNMIKDLLDASAYPLVTYMQSAKLSCTVGFHSVHQDMVGVASRSLQHRLCCCLLQMRADSSPQATAIGELDSGLGCWAAELAN